MLQGGPHRMVDSVLDGIAQGARGFVNSVASAIKMTGGALMAGLDKPFNAIIPDRQGPHRIADRLADGVVDTGVNFVNEGVIGSAQTAGRAVMGALDHPLEQIGDFKMPRFFGK